tara:strand:+ start:1466 stop:1675 length:210 start_codon:yes stop_codon:yes gene_type:complete
MKSILVLLIKFYQSAISQYLPSSCRYLPTCSQYGIDALNTYGIFKASYLIMKRLLKCNPFTSRGYDPVK